MNREAETLESPVVSDDELRLALDALDKHPQRISAGVWPAGLSDLESPGLYSWWVDRQGADDLAAGLGQPVPVGRIYLGQAGATSWPSGKRGSATLGSRIGGNHIRGRIRSSTFRLTLAAALAGRLDFEILGPKKMSPSSEALLSEWISQRLQVAIHPFDDRDALRDLEDRVLARLDPPLNLSGLPPTPLRQALSDKRKKIASPARPTERSSRARIQPPKAARKVNASARVTLHEEIETILREDGRDWMTTAEIAKRVNERGRYLKRDRSPVEAFQIHGRTKNYTHIFKRDKSRVGLAAR